MKPLPLGDSDAFTKLAVGNAAGRIFENLLADYQSVRVQ